LKSADLAKGGLVKKVVMKVDHILTVTKSVAELLNNNYI
jgi:hypothetical protein